jgi:hypothetical protein
MAGVKEIVGIIWELLRFTWRVRDRRRWCGLWPLPSPEYRYLRLRTYYGADFPGRIVIIRDTIKFGRWLVEMRRHM